MPSDKEMINNLIDNYINLQRIKADQSEVDYQLAAVRAKLESFGIVAENLDISKYKKTD